MHAMAENSTEFSTAKVTENKYQNKLPDSKTGLSAPRRYIQSLSGDHSGGLDGRNSQDLR